MGLFKKKPKETMLYEFEVAGAYKNQDSILPLYEEAESFDARVTREPTNKYDPKALKVSVGSKKIGYIYKHDQDKFHRLKDKVQMFVVFKEDWDGKIKATLYVRAAK